jgi:hypothetical protein
LLIGGGGGCGGGGGGVRKRDEIYSAQLNKFHLRMETESSLQNGVF